jgi:hypothetical protein
MASLIRLSACALWFFAVACSSDVSSSERPPEDEHAPDQHTAFVGTWECQEGATVSAMCPEPVLHQLDESYTSEIELQGKAGLLFRAQGGCELELTVEGNVARAAPGQTCQMVVGRTVADSNMERFELHLTPEGTLENIASGTTKLRIAPDAVLDCRGFEFYNVVLSPKR